MKEDTINTYNFDFLKIYFCCDLIIIPDILIIHQPTIGEIVEFGESRIESAINPFITNPTSCRVFLWEKLGIDWNKISDFELFMLLYGNLDFDDTKIIFGDFNFSELKRKYDDKGNVYLGNKDDTIIITEDIYHYISEYLRTIFNRHPKTEIIKGKMAKEWTIADDIEKSKKKDNSNSNLLPLVSAMVNHPGFKYSTRQLKDVGIFEFMDSVKRLQIYEKCKSFLNGMYSGMMDISKLSEKELNNNVDWLRDLYS